MRSIVAVLLAGVVLASGCGGSDTKADPPPSSPPSVTSASVPGATSSPVRPGPETLPLGKADLTLVAGRTYASPDGFRPALRITIPGDGWNSTHRGRDAFDIGRPVPGEDAALVVVAFVTPEETSTADALAAIRQRARGAGADVRGTATLRIRGGQGPLVTSRDASIALDAVPDGYTTVRADDLGGPLLTVTWVPDATNHKLAERSSAQLSAAVARTDR